MQSLQPAAKLGATGRKLSTAVIFCCLRGSLLHVQLAQLLSAVHFCRRPFCRQPRSHPPIHDLKLYWVYSVQLMQPIMYALQTCVNSCV